MGGGPLPRIRRARLSDRALARRVGGQTPDRGDAVGQGSAALVRSSRDPCAWGAGARRGRGLFSDLSSRLLLRARPADTGAADPVPGADVRRADTAAAASNLSIRLVELAAA